MTSNSSDLLGPVERLLSRKPDAATSLKVTAVTLGSISTVMELSEKDFESEGDGLASSILDTCDAWVLSRRKETPFFVSWFDRDRPIMQLPLRISPPDTQFSGLPPIDGSLESLIATLQATGIQQHKLMIEMAQAVVSLILNVVESQQARIQFLEGQEIEVRRLKNELSDIATSTDDQRFNKITTLVEQWIKSRLPNASLSP